MSGWKSRTQRSAAVDSPAVGQTPFWSVSTGSPSASSMRRAATACERCAGGTPGWASLLLVSQRTLNLVPPRRWASEAGHGRELRHVDIDEVGAVVRDAAGEGIVEGGGAIHSLGLHAHPLRHHREIRGRKLHAELAAIERAALDCAQDSVTSVVEDAGDDRDVVLDRGREFADVEHEAAVSLDDRRLRPGADG